MSARTRALLLSPPLLRRSSCFGSPLHRRAFWTFSASEPEVDKEDPHYVQKSLHNIYSEHVAPIEKEFGFSKWHTPELTRAEFLAPPLVLLLGQYSTGKTTMIEHLLGRTFPGSHTGPEPTTDKFVVVTYGEEERTIPGHAACSDVEMQYASLQRYGSSFLDRFEVTQVPSELLRGLVLLDTPGVLSGEKQRVSRGYDFVNVAHHLAERADMVLLLFDSAKLDISDEFKEVIAVLGGQHDKVRCLLNKADMVDADELFRVYGALLWSLGKVVNTPEVPRVFVASMRDGPSDGRAGHGANHALFERERSSLLRDLHGLPKQALTRRINETLKRWRKVRTHATLCSHLTSQFGVFGREKQQSEILGTLESTYASLARQHGLNVADFPKANDFRRVCDALGVKLWQGSAMTDSRLAEVDNAVVQRVRALLDAAKAEDEAHAEGGGRGEVSDWAGSDL